MKIIKSNNISLIHYYYIYSFSSQVQEMEIPRNKAERILREHKGNVVEALTELIN